MIQAVAKWIKTIVSKNRSLPSDKPADEHAPEKRESEPVHSDGVIHTGMFTDSGIELTDEQARAYFLIEKTNRNLFITGKAGSGKSVVLRFFRSHTSKRVAVLAPTGVSAINVDGQTIHSFFKLRVGPLIGYNPDKIRGFDKVAAKVKYLDAIVIDEISMVRADILDAIDKILRKAKGVKDLPFGGCQMIFFGDLLQLPPVISKEDHNLLNPLYKTGYFFEAEAIPSSQLYLVELSQVHRQSNQEFIDVLNRIREGCGDEEDFSLLATRVGKPDESQHCITLTLHKATAREINFEKLRCIPTKSFFYTADMQGDFAERAQKEKSFDPPAEIHLELRVGASVIMLTNDSEKRWVNGTLAVIHSLSDSRIDVAINRHIYSVDKHTWVKYKYEIDPRTKELVQYEIGYFTQFPIALAYAITIHKSQGQTYDRVNIDYAGSQAFSPGQTYVALSRCRSIEGLYLTDAIDRQDIKVSQAAIDWIASQKYNQATVVLPDVTPSFPCPVPRGAEAIPRKKLPKQVFEWLPDGRIKTDPPVTPKKITGTRFPQVLGFDSFSTPFQAWCAIMRLYEKPFEENVYTTAGKVIQPIQSKYTQELASKCTVKTPEEVFGANPEETTGYDFFEDDDIFGGMWDAVGTDDNGRITHVFEMKTTQERNRSRWDQAKHKVPYDKLLQGALYAYLLQLPQVTMVPSFLTRGDLETPDRFICTPFNTVHRTVKLDDLTGDFERDFVEQARQWWKDHVLTGVSPEVDPKKDREYIEALMCIVPKEPQEVKTAHE